MKLEKTNMQAAMAHDLGDDSVTLWQPGGLNIAIFPGTVVSVNTGWKIEQKAGEVVILELAKNLAMAGCLLAHPKYLTHANNGDLIVTIFNRSSFVVNLEPMVPICRLLSVALSIVKTVIGDVPNPPPEPEPVTNPQPSADAPAEGLTDRMIAAAKKIGKRHAK